MKKFPSHCCKRKSFYMDNLISTVHISLEAILEWTVLYLGFVMIQKGKTNIWTSINTNLCLETISKTKRFYPAKGLCKKNFFSLTFQWVLTYALYYHRITELIRKLVCLFLESFNFNNMNTIIQAEVYKIMCLKLKYFNVQASKKESLGLISRSELIHC